MAKSCARLASMSLLVAPDSMRQIAVCQKGHANTDPSLHRDGLVVAGVAAVQRLLVATYCCFVSVKLSLGVGRAAWETANGTII
jgi:hypothetical protein